MQRTNTCMKTFMSSVVREMHMQTKNIKKMKIKKQNTNFSPIVLAEVKYSYNTQWWQKCGEESS